MKTGVNWRNFTREAKNGITTEATYHGKYGKIFLIKKFGFFFYIYSFFFFSKLNFEFILNRGKTNETKYGFATREPLHGPVEYNKSYLKVISSIFKTKKNSITTFFFNYLVQG